MTQNLYYSVEPFGFFRGAVLARFRGSIDTRNQSRDRGRGNPLRTITQAVP